MPNNIIMADAKGGGPTATELFDTLEWALTQDGYTMIETDVVSNTSGNVVTHNLGTVPSKVFAFLPDFDSTVTTKSIYGKATGMTAETTNAGGVASGLSDSATDSSVNNVLRSAGISFNSPFSIRNYWFVASVTDTTITFRNSAGSYTSMQSGRWKVFVK
jgi:hypothetical protein